MNAAQDLIGGRYRLLEVIGTGGTGRVWLADDELLRRRVAVKEIGPPADQSTSRMLDAQLTTMREARAAARLEHPGVVGVYDVVWRPGCSWIVMEYVESRSLAAVLRDNGHLPHREAARIGLGVLSALQAAHAAGVLHRAVDPDNVLLATDGRVMLTGFGLATTNGTDQDGERPGGPSRFVAPEQVRGDDAGEPADLWSLGATLHAAVAGQAPFRSPAPADKQPGPVHPGPVHPGPLTPIIDALLADDPAQRLTSADAQARLRKVLENRVVGVFPMRVARQRVPAPAGTSAAGMAMIRGRMDGARPARGRAARSTKVALVAAAVLLAGTTGTALALDRRSGAVPVAGATGTTAGPVTVCAPGGTAVSGRSRARGYAVPAGWVWHTDPTGFDVAVPQGWTRSPDGTAACFRDPGGSRSFRVDASARLVGPALGHWQGQEKDAVAAGSLPGYRRVTMDVLTEKRGGAAWEFTWQPAGEPARRHERRLLLSADGGRAYLVEWTAPDRDWTGSEPYLRLVLASLS